MPHNEGLLADRMKEYEQAARTSFPKRLPLIVRVDGKAFSKLTSSLKGPGDPFNRDFVSVMDEVAKALCREIQGAQVAYVQSDECSVLVHGYKTFQSQSWFDNQLQKIVSLSAAIAAATFTANSQKLFGDVRSVFFDARAFILPESEVSNYMLWRQQDAMRNSVQMLARFHFSHKECDSKSCEIMKVMLSEKNVKWNDLPCGLRRGRCVIKRPEKHLIIQNGVPLHIDRSAWTVEDAPLFAQNREYIEHLLVTEDK